MKKCKQLLAIVGILLLVGLYAATIVVAILDPTSTMQYLITAIGATIVIPVFIWVIEMFFRISQPKEDLSSNSSSSKDNNSDNDQ